MGTVFNLPNQITIARLILSVVFFVLLGLFDQNYWRYVEFPRWLEALTNNRAIFHQEDWRFIGQPPPLNTEGTIFLNAAIAVFILAAASDFLDGYLARKWKMISTFGRIADPFVDKVFICGSFIFLIPISPLVQPWFVVVIIMREFLVSGLRSFLEARGVAFGAGLGGKLKMVLQSIAIPAVLFYRANTPDSRPMKYLVIVLLAGTLFFTVSSTVEYVRRAVALLRK
jgi:CDP-diacylglycerol--glycerol-3-phosphate 3-phosphatidyltransferase